MSTDGAERLSVQIRTNMRRKAAERDAKIAQREKDGQFTSKAEDAVIAVLFIFGLLDVIAAVIDPARASLTPGMLAFVLIMLIAINANVRRVALNQKPASHLLPAPDPAQRTPRQ